VCAPTSVTTLHAVLTSSLLQAYLASQVLSVLGIAAAVGIAFRKQLLGLVRSGISTRFMKTLFSRIVNRT